MTPKDAIKLAREKDARIVDLRFIDVPGLWQHFSIPVSELTEELFAEGIGFDGSSIRGFQTIDESDMLLFPDPATAVMDPFTADATLVFLCDVKDPVTGATRREATPTSPMPAFTTSAGSSGTRPRCAP